MLSAETKARLITLTETLIIPHITKTGFNNCFIIHFKEKINEANIRNLYVWSLLEFCFVFLVLMDTACYKIAYHRLTRQITELSASR